MSIKATFQSILHIENLTNIEIPHQGLFAIEAELYQQNDGSKNNAIPYKIIDNIHKSSNKVKGKPDINDCMFRTKIGYVKYSDQTIELNDMVQFKFELQAFPNLAEKNIFLEFHLLFTNRYYYDDYDIENFEATAIQSCRFKLQSIEQGILHYCEGQFTENYLSKFSFTFMTMLMDYKFCGYKTKMVQPTVKEKQRQKVNDLEQFSLWLKKYYQNCVNPVYFLYQKYVKPLYSQTYHFRGTVNNLMKIQKDINLKVSQHFSSEKEVTDKLFYQFLMSFKIPNSFTCQDVRKEISDIHTENFFFIIQLAQDFSKNQLLKFKMKESFQSFMKQKFGERVFRQINYGQPNLNMKQHEKIVKSVSKKQLILTEYPIIDVSLFLKKENQLIGFYEITLSESSKEIVKSLQKTETSLTSRKSLSQLNKLIKKQEEIQPYDQRNMFFVLCHGFQGSSYDMQMIQRGLRQKMPLANFLLSLTNQYDTQRNIEQMGQRLATEVLNYIDKNIQNIQQMIINFVGHSMGGIIARASLKYIAKYQKNLGIFFSLGSPHLGYLSGADGMIKTGLWFLNKWKKIVSIQQLSMDDSKKPRSTFMYKLSTEGSLKSFKKIVLISSMEDSFAPWNSARICAHKSTDSNSKLERQMINNILGQCPVHRIDIHFNVKKNDLDGFIGRTAHINLIIQDNIFKLINWTMPNLFDLKQI